MWSRISAVDGLKSNLDGVIILTNWSSVFGCVSAHLPDALLLISSGQIEFGLKFSPKLIRPEPDLRR